jgi:hypothetical protein
LVAHQGEVSHSEKVVRREGQGKQRTSGRVESGEEGQGEQRTPGKVERVRRDKGAENTGEGREW